MSFAQNLRQRRAANRTQRAVQRAISNAATPAMRDELIIVAQRQRLF
ncbi:hypothetical protein HJ590_13820 [Naumannella sp. ID2617S]|nr:hypothetical protein [Naumannella sp. ID2617S]